jgi:hypothetical protein
MHAEGTLLQLTSTLGANSSATSTFFEIKGVLRASSITMCKSKSHATTRGMGSSMTKERYNQYTIASTSYSATTLTQTITVNINAGPSGSTGAGGADEVCIDVASPFSMVPPEQPDGLGGYSALST